MISTVNPETNRAPSAGESLDVWQYVRVLFKYKWLIAGVAVCVAVLSAMWTMRQPKIYEAVCTLRYDPNPPRPLGSTVEEVASAVPSYWASREFYRTQNQIIGSRAVAELVVRDLKLHKNPDFFGVPEKDRKGWPGGTIELASRKLQARVTVDQLKETQLVMIRVRDTDPERARILANKVADAYIKKSTDERVEATKEALKELSVQRQQLGEELAAAEGELHAFKQTNNVLSVSLEDRQNIVSNNIARYSESLSEARTRRVKLQARLSAIKSLSRDNPFMTHSSIAAGSPTITTLRETYRTKLAEKQALSVKYGDKHPQMQRINAELKDLAKQLDEEIDGLIGSVESELAEARKTETGLRALLDEEKKAGLLVNEKESTYSKLKRARETNAKLYQLVLERSEETDLMQAFQVKHIQIIDRALRPTFHVSPRMSVNVALGGLLGLVLGILLAFIAAQLDRTLKSVEDVETIGLPVLGVLPRSTPEMIRRGGYGAARNNSPVDNLDLIVHSHPMSSIAESCRSIRTNLTFMSPDDPLDAIVVTSAMPQDGKTTVAINMAIAIAQSGKRVLLVDTDLRKPRIHKSFDIPRGGGITSVLVGEAKLDDMVQATQVPGLSVLPCGPIPPNPSELLHTKSFENLVAEVRTKFDRVIFDSPPVTVVTDAAIIAPQVSGAMIVVRSQNTTRDALRSVLRQVRDVSANVIGGVLNDLDPNQREYGYGKQYYYRRHGYYYGTDPDDYADQEDKPAAAE